MGFGIIATLKVIAPLTLYMVGVFSFVLALLGRTRWTLYLVVFLLPLRNVVERLQQFPLGNQFIDILIFGLIIGWFLSVIFERRDLLERSSLNLSSVVLVTYLFVSLLIGSFYLTENIQFNVGDPRVQSWKNFCLLPMIFFITLNTVTSKKEVWNVFLVMCLAMVLMGYYTTSQISWFSSLLSRGKITGTFQFLGPNEVAAFLNQYTIILMSVYFFMKRGRSKILLLCLILVNLYCVLFIFSRGAYLGMAIGMFILFAIKSKKLLVPLILALVLWQVVLPQRAIERIQSTQNEYGELDESAERRIKIWEKSMEIFQENPVVGIGYGVFQYLGFDLGDTHNIYVKILTEQGVVGMLVFLLVIFSFMKEGFGLYMYGDDQMSKGLGLGLGVCMFVLIANNFFGNRWTYLEMSGYLWVFAGLVSRLNALSKNPQPHSVVETSAAPIQSVWPPKKAKKSYYK